MIYVIEDDNSIREMVLYTLQSAGYTAEGYQDGEQFYANYRPAIAEAVLLDVMLPGENGYQILRRLRQHPESQEIPILLVTALGNEGDIVYGLDLGADDYLTKPFGTMELIARLRATLRRSVRSESDSILAWGSLHMDESRHCVTVDGQTICLTAKEYDVLRLLLLGKGAVVTRGEILNKVWQVTGDMELRTRTMDVHIRTLRQKLGIAGSCIETIRGIGYRLVRSL